MAVLGRSATNQGYPSTTTYYNYATGNLRDRGYSDSTSGMYGNTGAAKITTYSSTPSTTSSSTKKTSTAKKSSSSSTKSTASTAITPTYTYTSQPTRNYHELLDEGTYSAPVSSFDAASAYRKLLDAYQGRESDYSAYLDAMNAAAQNAYDRGMSSVSDAYASMNDLLNSSYNNQKDTLASNRQRAYDSLLDAYNRSRNTLSSNATDSLKQAYVNSMIARRDLGQRLSAMGLNGGMTETTLASLLNSYGNQRNDINKTLANNLSNLEGNYNNNLSDLESSYASDLASALQSYNSALANARAQRLAQELELENALASNKMNAQSSYQELLNNYKQNYYELLRSAIADGVDI